MNNHNHKWIKYIIAFVLAAGLFVFLQEPTLAAEAVKTEITINQTFEVINGDKTKPEDVFAYKLTSLDKGNPMPEGTDKMNAYQFKLDGKDDIKISMAYTHGGIYRYKLEPVIEKEVKGYRYDKSEYVVAVYVENDQEGLKSTVVVENEKEMKVSNISYKHVYEFEKTPEADDKNQNTGDQNNGNNQNTNNDQNKVESSSPKTGDSSLITVYIAACCLSFAGILFMIAVRRKDEH